jgi:hypothetical protein
MPLSALKLLEKAILPLTLVVCAKFGAVFILSFLTSSQVVFGNYGTGVNLFFLNYSDLESAIWVSTLSDLIASIVCALGFSWLLFRAQNLTLENIHPRSAGKLFRKGHHRFLTNASEMISEGLVWLSLGLAVVLLALINWSTGLTSPLVLGFILAISFGLGWALVVEIKRLEF